LKRQIEELRNKRQNGMKKSVIEEEKKCADELPVKAIKP
jgi:hypothetical protein